MLGHGFCSFTENAVGSCKEPRLQTSTQAQVRLQRNGFGGFSRPFRPTARAGSSHVKGCKKPAPGAGHFLLFFVVLLGARRANRSQKERRLQCAALAPLEAGDSSIPRPGCARLICILRGAGGGAGRLLLRRVNVLIKSWSSLVSAQSQMCLTACN